MNHLARGYAVFTSTTEVVLSSESYLFQLHNLLARTSNRTQANYFIWKTVESLIPFSSDEIRSIYAKYVDLPSREEHCLHETNRRFHNAIDKASLTMYNKDETLKALETMVNLLQSGTKINLIGVENPQSGFSEVSLETASVMFLHYLLFTARGYPKSASIFFLQFCDTIFSLARFFGT